MDVDALLAEEARRQLRRPCKFAGILGRLDPDDRVKLEAAGLSNMGWKRVLDGLGLSVSDTVVGRHRSGACACDE